jgi:DNA-directed RNA polymerase specialized sigma24 family protein
MEAFKQSPLKGRQYPELRSTRSDVMATEYLQGRSLADVAREFGVSTVAVWKAAQRRKAT